MAQGEFTKDGLERMHECPTCFYLVTDTVFRASRFNYTCPRCGKQTLSEFHICEWVRSKRSEHNEELISLSD